MSTDKEEFALYCEAKNDKVRKRLGIKGGFTGLQQKNYLLQSPAALPQWMTTIMMKTTLKNPSASICPLLTTFRQKACLIRNSATAMKKAGKMASQ